VSWLKVRAHHDAQFDLCPWALPGSLTHCEYPVLGRFAKSRVLLFGVRGDKIPPEAGMY